MPPAKRRKRVVVTDDEDDERDERRTPSKKNSLKDYFSSPDARVNNFAAVKDDAPLPTSPMVRQSTNTRPSCAASSKDASIATIISARSRSTKASSSRSPNQSPSKARKPIDEGNGNIRSLFSKQSQRAKAGPKSNAHSQKTDIVPLDLISDPLSDEEEIGNHRASDISLVGKKAQKRSRDQFESDPPPASGSIASGQRFLRTLCPTPTHTSNEIDQRPWSERFGPANLDELVVHKKKVADVRRWLHEVLSGRLRQRLLVLKGSAGTGKTTTFQLLAKDMRFEILEWRNPTETVGSNQRGGTLSSAVRFEEFMGHGRKFRQLEIDGDEFSTSPKNATTNAQSLPEDEGQRVILIEEFPNTFMRSGSALTSFRRTVLQYLASNTPSLASFGHNITTEQIIPVVMIVSETLLTTTSASADSFTAHRLLGAEILRHPGTAIIEFNDIAPTLLHKALEEIVKKEARVSGRRRTPGPQVLKRLGEIGDIRSAVSSLEFLCVKGDEDADWGSKVAFTKTKKSSKDQALTKGEQQSLELISQREASLGIFHAVGKVVYNKRQDQSLSDGSEQVLAEILPPHLSHMSRPKPSEVTVDTLIDETGTDISTFISAIHENYVLSCDRTGTADANSSVDYANGCIEYLSESDLLNPSWDVFFGGKGFAGNGRDQGSHVLRQDEMAFEVAVRGLLFSLPSPVKRKSTTSGMSNRGGGDAFKMYFPSSIKLWRTKEELESLVDLCASQMLKGGTPAGSSSSQLSTQTLTDGASVFRRSKSGSVGDFIGNRIEQKSLSKSQSKAPTDKQREEAGLLLSVGSSARQEMIQERLPYMAHMMRSRQISSLHCLELRDLEKIVAFHGIGGPAEEEEDEDAEEARPAGEGWATDKPSEEASPKKRRTTIKTRSEHAEGSMISSLQIDKLVLSDDDIEDD